MVQAKIIFIILLLITNCDSQNDLISNNIINENLLYVSNFQCDNCGEEKYSVDLSWSKYLGNDFISYKILDQNDNPFTNEITNKYMHCFTLYFDTNICSVLMGIGIRSVNDIFLKLCSG